MEGTRGGGETPTFERLRHFWGLSICIAARPVLSLVSDRSFSFDLIVARARALSKAPLIRPDSLPLSAN